MKILRSFSIFCFLLIGILGCTDGTNNIKVGADPIQQIFKPEKKGIFRGHNIGENSEKVAGREDAKVIVTSDTLLHYASTVDMGGKNTEMAMYLAFDDFGLFEIQTDIFPKDEETGESLMKNMAAYLNDNYGKANKIGMLQRWSTNSPSNNIVEITLSNETNDKGEPFISLNYLEPLDDEL